MGPLAVYSHHRKSSAGNPATENGGLKEMIGELLFTFFGGVFCGLSIIVVLIFIYGDIQN
jgi:hypothetical protein